MDKKWIDYTKIDQTKSSVIVVSPAFPRFVPCLLQQSLRNSSAAICCIACSLREDIPMGNWNKLLINIIANYGKNYYDRCIQMLCLKYVTKKFSETIKMDFGIEKCGVINISKGIVQSAENSEPNLINAPMFNISDTYKYLGLYQNLNYDCKKLKEDTKKHFIFRFKKILKTLLSSRNKITAINGWAVPLLIYTFGILKWNQTELDNLDRRVRVLMTRYRCHHPRSSMMRLYLPRKMGGRGLLNMKNMHNKEILSLRTYFITNRNKDGYDDIMTNDLGYSPLRLNNPEASLQTVSIDDRVNIWKNKTLHGRYLEVLKSRDVNFDESVHWLKFGNLFGETEGFVCAIQDQVIVTRNYSKFIMKQNVIDICRLCGQNGETLRHILSGCSLLAGNQYLERHNQVAKILHQKIALKYKLIDNELPYYQYKPLSVLENSAAKLYWDRPILTDRTIPANRPDIVLVDHIKNTTYIVDVTIPHDENLQKAERNKILKYMDLAHEIKDMWRTPATIVVPIVISTNGLIPKSLHANLCKVGVDGGLKYLMQKAVLLSTCRTLRKQYMPIKQLVSSFYVGDWKYTVQIEEALRDSLDIEDHCSIDSFERSITSLLKTGDSYILSIDDHDWALWMGDLPSRPSTSSTTYIFDPHRYVKVNTLDKFTKPKIYPSIWRFIHLQYTIRDLLDVLKTMGERHKIFIVTKFVVDSRQMITRNADEKFGSYIKKHCSNGVGIVERPFTVEKKRDPAPTPSILGESDDKAIYDSVLERGSGYFLNPKITYSCCPKKEFCKEVCTTCKLDFRNQIFLEKGLLKCISNSIIDKKELDHNNYVRHSSGKMCWVLKGNHGLSSYRECAGNQGITVAITALKRIDWKSARSWDSCEIDDIVKMGTIMFKEFCRQSCLFQRPTLLALCRCLGSSDVWGNWSTKTIAWGGRLDLLALIDGLISGNGRGLLQLPGSWDVAVWKDREEFYLFLPEDKDDEETPSRIMFFYTATDLSSFLADMIPTTADICVTRIDFSKEAKADVEEKLDEKDSFKCICIVRANAIEYKYGLPACVAFLAIVLATSKSSEDWDRTEIEQLIERAIFFLDTTMNDDKNDDQEEEEKEITLQDIPKRFILDGFGVVSTDILNNVVCGSLQYTTEKTNSLGLLEGFESFFKTYQHGVFCCRGVTMPIWKSPEGNFFYIKYLEKITGEGDGLDFCMLRLNSEELLAQYIESGLPVSRDNRYSISAVLVNCTKIDPVSGNVQLDLKGGYKWLVPNEIAVLRSWECPKLITECTLPAVMLFSCACSLLSPSKFTGHHLSSFVECSYDIGKRFKSQYRVLSTGILDNLIEENISFGIHSFQLQFGPKIQYYFDRTNRVDYSQMPVARNITPPKYDATALCLYFEKIFNILDSQQIIIRIDDNLVVSIWKLWPNGPVALLQPRSYFPISPVQDSWRLDETVANAVHAPEIKNLGKKGKGKGKKGKKSRKVGTKGKKGKKKKDGGSSKPAVTIFLYSSMNRLAKHFGTILPFGFSEGRLVAYSVRTKMLSQLNSTTINSNALIPREINTHAMPKIGDSFTLLNDKWFLLGNSISRCHEQGIEKRDKEFATSVMATVVDSIESVNHWNSELLDMIVKYGAELYSSKIPNGCGKRPPFTVPNNFYVSDFRVNVAVTNNMIVGDMMAPDSSFEVYSVTSGLNYFFGNEDKSHGILMARNYTVAVWKMNYFDFKRYKKSKEQYDYFMGQEIYKKTKVESIKSYSEKEETSLTRTVSRAIVYPDEFDTNGDIVIVDVVKTAEGKSSKRKQKNKKGKSKKGRKRVLAPAEPPLALLPEPPNADEGLKSISFKTISYSNASDVENIADVDISTEIDDGESEEENEEKEEEDERVEEEYEEGFYYNEGEGIPAVSNITGWSFLSGGTGEDIEKESYISPVLSYTTDEEISKSGSSVTSPSFSETFYPDDCAVFIWDPSGQCSPKLHGEYGKPATLSFHSTKDLATFFVENALQTGLGSNKFTLHGIQVDWRHKTVEERAASPKCPLKTKGLRDCRVGQEPATAYIHPGGGRTYLISGEKRSRKAAIKSALCWCVAALVIHNLSDISLWKNRKLDEIDAVCTELKTAIKSNNGCDCIDEIIKPEDIVKDFIVSKRQIHVDIEEIFNIQVQGNDQFMSKLKFAIDLFFKGKNPLGYIYVEDRPCCFMCKSREPNKLFLGTNWPKNHIIMYDTVDKFIIGFLTMMRELKQCILNIKTYKVFVTWKPAVG